MSTIDLNDIEDGVLLFDERHCLTDIGAGCERVLPGFSERLSPGAVLEDVYDGLLAMKLVPVFEATITATSDEIWKVFSLPPADLFFRTEDERSIRWSLRAMTNGNLLALISDVSKSRDLFMRNAHRERMQSIAELSGKIGHDVNNLLTIIQGNLELLETVVESNEKSTRWMRAAMDATERGSEFTEKLLFLGRRRPARRRNIDVADAVNRILDDVAKGDNKSIKINISIPSDLPQLRVDQKHFEYSVRSLVENALEATLEKGVIDIDASKVFIPNERPTDTDIGREFVRLVVSDSGVGMASRVKERAFEPFFTTKDDAKGRGVGLSLVYGFARQTDGLVVIESVLGEGTQVTLMIPATEVTESKTDIFETENVVKLGDGEEILVIDDDYAVRMIAADMIESLGYSVTLAKDASDALHQLKNAGGFDMIFSDVVMPGGIDGIHLARIVRDRYPDTKILLASGYFDTNRLAGAEEFSFVAKPYDVNQLGQEIQRALKVLA